MDTLETVKNVIHGAGSVVDFVLAFVAAGTLIAVRRAQRASLDPTTKCFETRSLIQREEKLDRARDAFLRFLACVQLHRADEINRVAMEAVAANAIKPVYLDHSVKRLKLLSNVVRRQLETTMPTLHGFARPVDTMLEQVEETFNIICGDVRLSAGLFDGSPAVEPPLTRSEMTLFVKTRELLARARAADATYEHL